MKSLNKIISLVMLFVFICSILVVPAVFAAIGDEAVIEYGNETLVIKYYSDSECENEISTAKAGDSIYARLSLNIPTTTFASFEVGLSLTGMTFEEQTNEFSKVASMSIFERPQVGALNNFEAGTSATNLFVTLTNGKSYSKPVNKDNWLGEYYFETIGVSSLDLVTYKVKVDDDAQGSLSFNKTGGVGLDIGYINDDLGERQNVPYAFTSSTLTVGEAPTVVTTSYDTYSATINKTEFNYATFDENDIDFTITAKKYLNGVYSEDVTLTKGTDYTVTYNSGTNGGTVDITYIGEHSDEESVTNAATITLINLPISYGNITAEFSANALPFPRTATDSQIIDEVIVKATKTTGDKVENDFSLTLDSDYTVSIDRTTLVATVSFINSNITENDKKLSFTFEDIVVTYNDFALTFKDDITNFRTDVSLDTIKAGITVSANKYSDGVLDGSVTVPSSAYTININDTTVTITFTGSVYVNEDLTSQITWYTDTELKNYAIIMNNNAFNDNVTESEIISEIVVKADYYENDVLVTSGQELVLDSNYTVDVDINARTVKVSITNTQIEKSFTIMVGEEIIAQFTSNDTKVEVGDNINADLILTGVPQGIEFYGAKFVVDVTNATINDITPAVGYKFASKTINNEKTNVIIDVISDATQTPVDGNIAKITLDTTSSDENKDVSVVVSEIQDEIVYVDSVNETFPQISTSVGVALNVDVYVPEIPKQLVTVEFNIKTIGSIEKSVDKFKSALKLYDNGAEVDVSNDIVLDIATKKITLSKLLEEGTYTVKFEVAGYTKAEVDVELIYDETNDTFTVNGGSTYDNDKVLNSIYAGDFNGDNIIAADDYSDIVAIYNTENADDMYNLYTYDEATKINKYDISIVANYFRQLKLAKVNENGLLNN